MTSCDQSSGEGRGVLNAASVQTSDRGIPLAPPSVKRLNGVRGKLWLFWMKRAVEATTERNSGHNPGRRPGFDNQCTESRQLQLESRVTTLAT